MDHETMALQLAKRRDRDIEPQLYAKVSFNLPKGDYEILVRRLELDMD